MRKTRHSGGSRTAEAAPGAPPPGCEAFADVVDALRALPGRDPSPDLADRVMDAVRAEAAAEKTARRWRLFRHALAAAACLAILAYAGLRHALSTASPPDAVASLPPTGQVSGACDWLAGCQEADGTWIPSRFGGTDSYLPALTGLAAMALGESPEEAHLAAACRAADALAALQRPDGSFSSHGLSQLYNQGIATRALFQLRERTGSAAWDGALRSAVAFIRARQSSAGGWDYTGQSPGNTALTVWQLDALAQARNAGWGDPEGHLRRGLRWLGAQVGEDGSVAYRSDGDAVSGSSTLSAMGAWGLLDLGREFASLAPAAARALDRLSEAGDVSGIEPSKNLYRDFFAMRAFRAGNRAEAGEVAARVAATRDFSPTGGGGAWRAEGDPWDRAGGDLYATTVALLALSGP
ncbi:MAG: hypothetical protein ACOX5G_12490 [Kiritimatiellia bacterium]|jgi:hypothetical protein